MNDRSQLTTVIIRQNVILLRAGEWEYFRTDINQHYWMVAECELGVVNSNAQLNCKDTHGKQINIHDDNTWNEFAGYALELFSSESGGMKLAADANAYLQSVKNSGWRIMIDRERTKMSDIAFWNHISNFSDEDDGDDEENVMRGISSGNGDRLGF